MYTRFMKMLAKYGSLAAYLLTKIETRTLTKEDVETAAKQFITETNNNSALVQIIVGNLEYKPDLEFLTREGVQGIAFDLNMSAEQMQGYLEKLGYNSKPITWEA